jgi:hypothetical protein
MQAIYPGSKQTLNLRTPRPARLEFELLESRNLPSIAVAPAFTLTPISASEIDVTWSDVSGLPDKNYVVNEMGANGSWQTLETVASGAGSYTDKVTGLNPDTPYEFEVGGTNPPYIQGDRLYPGSSSFATPQTATTLVPAPSFTIAPIGYSAIQVDWQDVTNFYQKIVAQYTINWWANGVEQKPINVITNTIPTSSYKISNLNDADTYTVQVGADCPDQNATSWSPPQTLPPLAAPGFSLSSPGPTEIAVSWGNVPQATGYEIQQVNANGSTLVLESFNTPPFNNYNYTFISCAPATTYSLVVTSLGPWGSASESAQQITTQSDVPVVSATPKSTTEIDLSWNAILGATFDVEEFTATSASPTILKTGVTGTSFPCTGLATNSAYSFAVRADGPWGQSGWSTATPSTYVYPTAPTSFTATAQNSTTIKFAWSGVPNTNGYFITYTSGAFVYSQPLDVTTRTLSLFSPASTYSFVVQVSNSTGWSTFSPVATATTWPSAPVFDLTNQSPSSVWVSWNPVSGANHYDIEYWIDGSQASTEQTTTASGTSELISSLQSGTRYDFTVAADNTSSGGGASYASNYQTIQTISVGSSQFKAGYLAITNSSAPFTEAFGTWVVPTVTNTAPSGSGSWVSAWVGIDDDTGAVLGLPQIGITWDSTNGYWPWVEIANNGTQQNPGTYFSATDLNTIPNSIPNQGHINIQPGDTISAGVIYDSSTTTTSTYTFDFQDTAHNGSVTQWSEQVTTASGYIPARTDALWMVESPSFAGRTPYAPLANFNLVTFSGAWASNGTTTGPITDFGLKQWDMKTTGSNNGGIATTGPITNLPLSGWQEPSGNSSSAFSVNFVSAVVNGPASPVNPVATGNTQNTQAPAPSNAQSNASQMSGLAPLDPAYLPVPKLLSGTRGKSIATVAPALETTEQLDATGLFDGSFGGPYVDAEAGITDNAVTSSATEASTPKPQTNTNPPGEPAASDGSEASSTDEFLPLLMDVQTDWHKRLD